MKAPIVEEIHKHRQEHAAKFNYDIHAIFADIRKREKELQKKGFIALRIVNAKRIWAENAHFGGSGVSVCYFGHAKTNKLVSLPPRRPKAKKK
ncbi:MAG: hypothetical protein HZA50_09685 [Planctomycetes bacterium]|nr:hypothetical protein [Planctomycetota bacterium]